jgi:drug/metabolite transporter (DMT)-like permease
MERSVVAAAALAIVTWASAFVAIRYTVAFLGPGTLAFTRLAGAGVVLGGWAAVRRGRGFPRLRKVDLPRVVVLGATGFCGYHLALNCGERTVSAGAASLLVSTVPLWTAAAAAFLLGERLTLRAWAGMVLSLAGAVLVSLGEGGVRGLFSGDAALVLLAAAVQGTYFVLQKPVLTRYPPLALTAYTLGAGVLLLLPWAGPAVRELVTAPRTVWLAVAYLAVVPTVVGYAAWSFVLRRTAASRAGPWLFLVPPASVGMGWALLGEQPKAATVAGGITLIVGVLLAAHRRKSPAEGCRPAGCHVLSPVAGAGPPAP